MLLIAVSPFEAYIDIVFYLHRGETALLLIRAPTKSSFEKVKLYLANKSSNCRPLGDDTGEEAAHSLFRSPERQSFKFI